MKRVLLFIIILFVNIFSTLIFAQQDFEIIPEWSDPNALNWKSKETDLWNVVKEVWTRRDWSKETVWDRYNKKADSMKNDTWNQMATWIMNWDTILNYIKYLWNFLTTVWIVIAAWMFIYAGYLYAMNIYQSDWTTKWNKAIHWAIVWLLIIVFSFAIVKLLINMFW